MRQRIICAVAFIFVLVGVSIPFAANDELHKQAVANFSPLPDSIPTADNPITPQKVALGKMLFYDTRISVDRTVSCFKCHWINLYGTDGLRKAIGNHYKLNPRNSPTVFNTAGQISEHWIGNRTSVEDQAKKALLGAGSYGLASYDDAEKNLKAIPGYESLFYGAFPQDADPVSVDNFASAIGAFERTLVTPSPFDAYLKGDTSALSPDAKAGLQMFMDIGCVSCHGGTYVGGEQYQKFGLSGSYWKLTGSESIDSGRYVVTHEESDLYKFKVPMLRNVEMTAPYFHDGSVDSLVAAIRIMGALQLDTTLDSNQTAALAAFLKSLTGKVPVTAREVPVLPPEE
jgi:cytochrome c peroxidase